MAKERWGSRIGLVLAAAGNAIGIGNLLRFPSQAAQNGGGAFMIPYVISLLIFGLPMMWIAWTIGRYGGKFGHSSLPGMFDKIWPRPISKYIGVIGLALPMVFCLYYTYIEAWCLAYSFFSLTGKYLDKPGVKVDLSVFYNEFLGNATSHSYFPGVMTALVFLVITLFLNILVLGRGIARGIELLAKIAMPLLFLFCFILSVRVLTVKPINGSAWDGLSFLWTPDFSALRNPNVWMAAAGQIFFTLSIGFGALECYASYVREKEDIALSGLATAATNEFVEVIFGSLIAIPAAAIFFGPSQIQNIASQGAFAIGMISMPEILRSMPAVQFFGTIWFLLLFFAAFTSSVAVCQPIMAFLQDELKLRRGAAASIVGLVWFLGTVPVIFFYKYGFLNELDYWAGTVGLVVVAIVEILLFLFAMGLTRGWKELHEGASISVPPFFRFIIKYVTPVALIAIFIGWTYSANLKPKPVILWNVADRSSFPGEFRSEIPNSSDEFNSLQSSIIQTVQNYRRDFSAWVDIEINKEGDIHVLNYSTDPRFEAILTRDKINRWLQLQNFRYVSDNSNNAELLPIKATLGIEVIHVCPYIWLSRFLMIFFIVAFLLLIRSAWKSGELVTHPEEVMQ